MDYTRKEQDTIRDAFRHLECACLAWDTNAPNMLRDALRHEKRERSSIHAARALLLESFADGFRKPDKAIASAYGRARGCLLVLVLGAGMAEGAERNKRLGYTQPCLKGLLEACDRASAVHNGRLERYMAEISKH